MLKIGTVKELERVKKKIPFALYNKIYNIVTILDHEYGEHRNIDVNDGGFVILVDSVEAVLQAEKIIDININKAEYVEIINDNYLHIFFLRNNEFGINLIIQKELLSRENIKIIRN